MSCGCPLLVGGRKGHRATNVKHKAHVRHIGGGSSRLTCSIFVGFFSLFLFHWFIILLPAHNIGEFGGGGASSLALSTVKKF